MCKLSSGNITTRPYCLLLFVKSIKRNENVPAYGSELPHFLPILTAIRNRDFQTGGKISLLSASERQGEAKATVKPFPLPSNLLVKKFVYQNVRLLSCKMSSTGEKWHNSLPRQILSVHVECTRLFFLALVCRGRLICLSISSRILARIEAMKTPETNTIEATYLSVMTWVCGIHELRSKGNLHGGRRRKFYWEECTRKYHEPVHYINAQFCPSLSRDPDFVFVCLPRLKAICHSRMRAQAEVVLKVIASPLMSRCHFAHA